MLSLPLIILTAAAQVLSKGHHVLHNVELSVRKPASKDQCRLLLRGINPNTSTEMIELYVENTMGLNESDYTLYPSPGRDLILIHHSQPFSKGVLDGHMFCFLKNTVMFLKCFRMFRLSFSFMALFNICFLFCRLPKP